MKLLKWVPLVVFIPIALIFLIAIFQNSNQNTYKAVQGAKLPRAIANFTLPQLGNEERFLSNDIFQGNITILNVWASWCVSCRYEHEFLNHLAQEQKEIRLIGLNYHDNSENALRWLEEFGNPYALNLKDGSGTLALELGVTGVPETYLIDPLGIIRVRFIGVLDADKWAKHFLPMIKKLTVGASDKGESRGG